MAATLPPPNVHCPPQETAPSTGPPSFFPFSCPVPHKLISSGEPPHQSFYPPRRLLAASASTPFRFLFFLASIHRTRFLLSRCPQLASLLIFLPGAISLLGEFASYRFPMYPSLAYLPRWLRCGRHHSHRQHTGDAAPAPFCESAPNLTLCLSRRRQFSHSARQICSRSAKSLFCLFFFPSTHFVLRPCSRRIAAP